MESLYGNTVYLYDYIDADLTRRVLRCDALYVSMQLSEREFVVLFPMENAAFFHLIQTASQYIFKRFFHRYSNSR